MRRILRKIAENEFGSLGDISTLADPGGWTRWWREGRTGVVRGEATKP